MPLALEQVPLEHQPPCQRTQSQINAASLLFANSLIPANTNRVARIAYYHAAMCLPSLSTWCDVIDTSRLTTWPNLTSTQEQRHPPQLAAMIKGHLNQQGVNICSTQPTEPSIKPTTKTSASAISPKPDPVATSPMPIKSHYLYAACQHATGQVFTDQTGHFLLSSSAGYSNLLIL
jgi:hypothetical protein